MIIQRIEVKNFHSLKDVGVDCDELVAILGRNGSGKSSLLKAIEAFYDVGFLANAFDYFGKDTTSEISIRILLQAMGSVGRRRSEAFEKG